MARVPHNTDFVADVEGIGTFVFGRRKMADHVKIQVEYARLTEGVEPTPWLESVATWLAVLKILTVRAPDDFDLDELDPLDDETYAKLLKIYACLRAKEDSFRRGSVASSQGDGQAAGGDT